MSDPLKIALIRAAIGSVAMAGVTFFTAASQGQSLKVAGIAAGAAFFTYLITRGGIEGLIDTQAAAAPAVPKTP